MTDKLFRLDHHTGEMMPIVFPRDRDACAINHGGADTSSEAFAKTGDGKRDAMRRRITAHIAAAGDQGATCDEVEVALELPHQTASARIAELRHRGVIQYDKARRKTRTGSSARVYFISTGGQCD